MKRRRRIAPRLVNGECRMRVYLNLPPEIRQGIRAAARIDQCSVSWVIEQLVIEGAGLRTPAYVTRKGTR